MRRRAGRWALVQEQAINLFGNHNRKEQCASQLFKEPKWHRETAADSLTGGLVEGQAHPPAVAEEGEVAAPEDLRVPLVEGEVPRTVERRRRPDLGRAGEDEEREG
jgi:hypothetical protein